MSKATVEIEPYDVIRYHRGWNILTGKTVGGFRGIVRYENKNGRSYPPEPVTARTIGGVIKKAREWIVRMDGYEGLETEFFEL